MPEDKGPALSKVEGLSRSQREEKVLQFWKNNQIFEKSLEKKSPKGEFVFYDGPPFATGLPHHGSLLSSIIKDVVPRYKTMRGFHVPRRWGWDCHGLPIENMVEKELGIKNKKEIEVMGVDKFNRACRDSVLRYVNEWKKFVERVGRFVDFDNSYKTMDNSFIESVWWGLSEIHNKGLLYEGRKVLLYCPHCETPLAKAEIAMDQSYKDITEESVYVKFKVKNPEKIGLNGDVYLLAWTTTPWTLPGNVALAVGENIEYLAVENNTSIDRGLKNGELHLRPGKYIFSSNFLPKIIEEGNYFIDSKKELRGKDLVGLEYEPLYEISAARESKKKAWYVTMADFVNTEEGTGVIHTAVLYGEDDYELGLKLDLPMIPLLDQSAHFNNNSPEFIKGQYFKKAEKAIKEDLENRGLLLKKEMHTHSYPHCHRCGTALLYNAISSWFINIQKVKEKMLKLNEKINWIPEHLKHGRFLNNLESAPDWTISRNRYWASPLPIWKDAEGKVYVIDSIKTLQEYTKKSGNKYFLMRHGGTEGNFKEVVSYKKQADDHLTEKGKTQTAVNAQKLRDKKIDIIIASPFVRTRETAEIVANIIGINSSDILFDNRIQEMNPGEYDGKSWPNYHADMFSSGSNWFTRHLGNSESLLDCQKRIGEFLYETENKYKDKNILIVTHGGPAWLFYVNAGLFLPDHEEYKVADTHVFVNEFKRFNNAEVRELPFIQLPHDENFNVDLHRPYIDQIGLISPEGKPLKRIPEVIDGWVESGSMPFASDHYPFENEKKFKKDFPADFIAEYIAQTRTWFYYMHAIAMTIFNNISFKNVVTTGTILAADGSKMSKSKGNYTDPMIIFDSFGADAMRYYLMSSVVMQAEDIRFVDDEVKQVHNQILNTLWNSFKFYEIYAEGNHAETPLKSSNILDKWIVSRLNQLILGTTEAMDVYDMVRATRPMRDFISDFSTWYIRRSRNRFKGNDEEDKAFALGTTRFVLKELSKLIAPIMPFIAEDIYQEIKLVGEPESINLCEWPKVGKVDEKLIKNMNRTRAIVSLALEARSKANIKVRQPLSELRIKNDELGTEYVNLIQEELNVKEVVQDKNLETEIKLDTNITPELAEEGRVREVIRSVQEMRKEKNLKPKDVMEYEIKSEEKDLFKKHGKEIARATNIEILNS